MGCPAVRAISAILLMSLFVLQILLGMFIPLGILVLAKSRKFNDDLRKLLYFTAVILIQLGIFSTRWNVVIGGQLFSKSFRELMAYKMEVMGIEGLLTTLLLLALPFVILAVLIRVLPTRPLEESVPAAGEPLAPAGAADPATLGMLRGAVDDAGRLGGPRPW